MRLGSFEGRNARRHIVVYYSAVDGRLQFVFVVSEETRIEVVYCHGRTLDSEPCHGNCKED